MLLVSQNMTLQFRKRGDGRKLQRTLTGNSIHYVLDAAGRPVDALPGLYAPKVFHQMLMEAEEAAKQFERAIAQDTVRNEYLMLPQIHQWFANWSTTDSLSRLNERVYTSLFLTPSSDPWLGLAASDVYTGIEANSEQQP
jgi:hypothetical protein